jgi:hypothetical protein
MRDEVRGREGYGGRQQGVYGPSGVGNRARSPPRGGGRDGQYGPGGGGGAGDMRGNPYGPGGGRNQGPDRIHGGDRGGARRRSPSPVRRRYYRSYSSQYLNLDSLLLISYLNETLD